MTNKKLRYIVADLVSLLIFSVALVVMIGWFTGISNLKDPLLTGVEMKANAALNFMLLALSLYVTNPSRTFPLGILIVRIFITLVLVISILTVIEYAASVNLGIDLFAASDYKTAFPGRMALNTAISFILAAFSLLLLTKRSGNLSEFIRVLSLFVSFICLLSIVGYIFGIKAYASFFIFNAMALHTAILFLLFFYGLLMILKRDYLPMKKLEYQTIAAFSIALLTIILIGVVAVKNSYKVIEANILTNETFKVLNNIEEIFSLTKDLETGVRGFALSNDSIFLDQYNRSEEKIKLTLKSLKQKLSYNPVQKRNIDTLEQLITTNFGYLTEVIYVRTTKGLNEVSKLVSTASGKKISDNIRVVTANMQDVETALLETRSAEESENTRKTLVTLLLFIFVPFGLLVFIYVILRRNIHEHYRNEESIRNRTVELEQRYKILFNEMPDGFGLHEMIFDKNNKPVDYRFVDLNPAFEALTGLDRKKVIGKTILEIAPDIEKYWIEMYGDVVLNKKTVRFENYAHNFNRYYEVSASPFSDNQFVAIFIDITERKKSEEVIKAQLKEKEVLLRELYHRTKNNMQVISSFLGLKAESIQDENIKVILSDMKNRIQTIALVHQKLYQSQNLSWVDLKEYLTDLSQLILSSYFHDPGIELKLELESINVLIDTAIPCGLIINELVSNSIKYAFPNGKKGELKICLRRIDQEIIELIVADNGIGLPSDLDIENTNTLGLLLFRAIAEDQLQGQVTMNTIQGVSATIRFKDIHYEERV